MSYTQVEELRELQGINNSRDIKARFDRSELSLIDFETIKHEVKNNILSGSTK